MFDHSDSCGTDLMGDFKAPDGKDTRGEKTEQINTWKRSSWETMGSIFLGGAKKTVSFMEEYTPFNKGDYYV